MFLYVMKVMKDEALFGFGTLHESRVHDWLFLGVNSDRVCEKLLGKRDR